MWFSILPASQEILDFSSLPSKAGPSGVAVNRKIAIENLAILQTGDLPAILRCRRIFALHRIGYIRLIAKMASASSGRQLASFPKNQCLFLGKLNLIYRRSW